MWMTNFSILDNSKDVRCLRNALKRFDVTSDASRHWQGLFGAIIEKEVCHVSSLNIDFAASIEVNRYVDMLPI